MQLPADILVKALYDTFPDPVLVMDGGGIIVAANPAATTVLGYAEQELVGMEAAGLEVKASGHAYPEATAAAAGPAGWRRRTAQLRGNDGRVLAVELSRTALPSTDAASGGTVMVIRDLAPLSRALEEHSGSTGLLRSALESVSLGFAIYDGADRLVLCNNAYRTMHAAFTPAIKVGKTFEAILVITHPLATRHNV